MSMTVSMEVYDNFKLPKWYEIAQIGLRTLTILSTIVSIVVMATSNTSVLLGGILKMDARFYYSSAFTVLMGVDAAVCITTSVSLGASTYFFYKAKLNRVHWYWLYLHDLIMMVLMISACGAATSIGYVAMHGQPKTMWLKICNNVEKFCVHVGVSVLFSYVAFLCLVALTIASSYLLMEPFLRNGEPSSPRRFKPKYYNDNDNDNPTKFRQFTNRIKYCICGLIPDRCLGY